MEKLRRRRSGVAYLRHWFTGSESELGVRSLRELSNQVTGKLGARPD